MSATNGVTGAGGSLAPTTNGASAAPTPATAANNSMLPPTTTPATPNMGAGSGGAAATPPPASMTPGVMTTPPPAAGAAGAGGGMATTPAPVDLGPGQTLPPVTDYSAPGPFQTTEIANTGPDGNYTMFRPVSLGDNGFKHPILTWGNGITTTPDIYPILLSTVASHGFVVIASNDTAVTPDEMSAGLDWLIQQNDAPGELQGKLDVNRAVSMGYSLGGGGAVTTGAHPNVIATIAMHPAAGFPTGLHGPLLLFSGTNDTVCVPDAFVQPVFDGSPVPTFFAMLDGADHLEPVLTGGRELAPSIAWLRLWVYDDQGARDFFYGDNCTLCQAPFVMPQRKMLQ